ncbi:MAG TPA: MraY family glycosyltransferase [Anaerovoracaceae bacterium]|nr:MraY family glycosyltransferase [Anaerovoracaceae bacterium]
MSNALVYVLLASFFVAFVLAAVFTPVAIKLAPKIGAMDIPKDERRMHTHAMPRFGGMAVFIGTTISLVLCLVLNWQKVPELAGEYDTRLIAVICGGVFVYLLGIVDDLKNLSPKVKFIGQVAVACVMYAFDLRIEFITNYFGGGLSHFGDTVCFIVTILWIVGITNTVNLVDGLDGLAAGVSAIASLCIAYVAYIHGMYLVACSMLALAGGTLGFLPFNFYPAKIFMGDGGSLFLGFMLGTLSILGPVKGATVVAVIVPVIVLGLPIFDTAFAILRRIVNKRPIMEADKGHLHHKLMQSGYGQRRAVLMLYGISGIMGVAAVLISRGYWVETAGLVGITAIYLYVFLTDANHLAPHIKAVDIKKDEAIEKVVPGIRDNTSKEQSEEKCKNKEE